MASSFFTCLAQSEVSNDLGESQEFAFVGGDMNMPPTFIAPPSHFHKAVARPDQQNHESSASIKLPSHVEKRVVPIHEQRSEDHALRAWLPPREHELPTVKVWPANSHNVVSRPYDQRVKPPALRVSRSNSNKIVARRHERPTLKASPSYPHKIVARYYKHTALKAWPSYSHKRVVQSHEQNYQHSASNKWPSQYHKMVEPQHKHYYERPSLKAWLSHFHKMQGSTT